MEKNALCGASARVSRPAARESPQREGSSSPPSESARRQLAAALRVPKASLWVSEILPAQPQIDRNGSSEGVRMMSVSDNDLTIPPLWPPLSDLSRRSTCDGRHQGAGKARESEVRPWFRKQPGPGQGTATEGPPEDLARSCLFPLLQWERRGAEVLASAGTCLTAICR